LQSAFSDRVHAVRFKSAKQATASVIELHRIAFAERKTARATKGSRTVRGRAGRETIRTPKRDRPQHGCYGQRVASWQALKGKKPQERRPGQTTPSCVRQCDGGSSSQVPTAQAARPGRRCQVRRVPTTGKQHADWFGRPARGDGEGVEAQAKELRDDAGGDEQGEKRPVGWFEIKTRRPKPIGRTRARIRIHSRRPKARGRRSERLGNERSIAWDRS